MEAGRRRSRRAGLARVDRLVALEIDGGRALRPGDVGRQRHLASRLEEIAGAALDLHDERGVGVALADHDEGLPAVLYREPGPGSERLVAAGQALPLADIIGRWAVDTARLSVKIFAIIMVIMVTIETMKAFHLIGRLIAILRPAIRFMGLDQKVGMLWLAASIFGITYGAAVIVEEAKENDFEADELTKLHLSIGINHAMIEDPALFLPLGIGAFWLWVPRLVSAFCAVWLLNLWLMLKRRRQARLALKNPCIPPYAP